MANSKILIERLGKVQRLDESESAPIKGRLGRLRGTCADYANPTRNRRLYPEKLWDRVLESSSFQENIQTKTLFGELDHPADRLESCIANAAVVLVELKKSPETKTLVGTFDILDTPAGRIVKSLVDYGCELGVSSRGDGDVITEGDHEVVKEDSYNFITFDIVALPAVKAARPAMIESLAAQKTVSLKESLTTQVNSAKTHNELELIKDIIRTTNLPDMDSLLETIDNKLSEKSETNDVIIESLTQELAETATKLEEAEQKIAELSNVIAESKKGESKLAESQQNLAILSKQVSVRDRIVKSLKLERVEAESKLVECQAKLAALSPSVDELRSQAKAQKEVISNLKGKMRQVIAEKQQLLTAQQSLKEHVTAQEQKLKALETKSSSYQETIKRLEEQQKTKAAQTLTESQSIKQNYQTTITDILDQYAKLAAKNAGLRESIIAPHLGKFKTIKAVNELIHNELDRADRLNSLPIQLNRSKDISAVLTESVAVDPEHIRLKNIILNAKGK